MKLSTTKMSSKGQVVIPEEIREAMNLKQGVKFIVVYENDTIVFKLIREPSVDELIKLMDKAQETMKNAGIDSDIVEAEIKAYRSENKKH